jgi:hypothetical protein
MMHWPACSSWAWRSSAGWLLHRMQRSLLQAVVVVQRPKRLHTQPRQQQQR